MCAKSLEQYQRQFYKHLFFKYPITGFLSLWVWGWNEIILFPENGPNKNKTQNILS